MIPGRVYYVNRDNVSITAASTPQDFITITAPATMILLVLGGSISQSTRYGDSTAEALRVQFNRYASLGSGGSAITPAKQQVGGPTATFTARGGDSLGTTATLLRPDAFHIQAGYPHEPTDFDIIVVPPSGNLGLTLPEDLPSAATISVSGWLVVMEVG